jgi:hypothetical protein
LEGTSSTALLFGMKLLFIPLSYKGGGR